MKLFIRSFCFIYLAFFLVGCSITSIETKPSVTETPVEISDHWIPLKNMSFQIQFSSDLDLEVEADVFDLDAFDTDSASVQYLHKKGKSVICYINAGAIEDWRPDVALYPLKVIGKAYQGWPGENWLDIRDLESLAPILEARLDLCKSKGFDGVEFDNVDGYQNDTGFELTAFDQLTFNRWLADAAHQRGLAAGLKNDPDQIDVLEPWFDFLIVESCFDQGWCDQAQPFVESGKLVIDIEYRGINQYCVLAKNSSITLIGKNQELKSKLEKCP